MNHFIELGVNQEGRLSITIHSGSRKSGHSVGGTYMTLSKQTDTELPGGFLYAKSEAGQAYWQDLQFMLNYALENRRTMMFFILEVLGLPKELMLKMINENHNHCVVHPEGFLHRKGATPAEKGQIGVIPGSMYAGVYITEGLGNEEYLSSASHGAGRTMSRRKARETLSVDKFAKLMRDGDILAVTNESTLDEAPWAYKDLNTVVNRQEGVVIKVIDFIQPILNIKDSKKN